MDGLEREFYAEVETVVFGSRTHTIGFSLKADNAAEAYEKACSEGEAILGVNASNKFVLRVHEMRVYNKVDNESKTS